MDCRADLEEGLFLLEDFGNRPYLKELTSETAGEPYHLTFETLLRIQSLNPPYTAELLERELELFRIWAVERLWRATLPPSLWEVLKALLIDNALQQSQVLIHRDYHSRNLMEVRRARLSGCPPWADHP